MTASSESTSSRVAGAAPQATAPRISIVFTNWNGKENLIRSLPGALRSLEFLGTGGTVIVADDASDDGSADCVRTNFPSVQVVALARHAGFGPTANAGVAAATTPLVALLSNDMVVDERFLVPLVSHFDDPTVFAVGAGLVDADGKPLSGRVLAWFLGGGFVMADSAKGYRPVSFLAPQRPGGGGAAPTFFVGGNALIDRAKFLALGGFDALYHPFYWEDVDLCYRAWKRGWKVLHDPASQVTHDLTRGTIRRAFSADYVRTIRRRNRLLFTWRNVASVWMIVQHLAFLSAQALLSWAWLDVSFYRALWAALPLLPQALARRHAQDAPDVLSDAQVLATIRRAPVESPGASR